MKFSPGTAAIGRMKWTQIIKGTLNQLTVLAELSEFLLGFGKQQLSAEMSADPPLKELESEEDDPYR